MRVSDYVGDKLDIHASRWLEEIRALVPPRPQLRLESGRSALLVIDMVSYFASPKGRCYLPASKSIVQRIKALLALFRAHQRPVVYTRHGHEGGRDLGMLGRFFSDYIRAGEPDSEVIGELLPGPDEAVILKTTYDAFLNTAMEDELRKNAVEQVLLTGVLTHMCCETTARSAFCRGFEVFVPVDAVASSNEALHRNSLLSMADCVAVLTSVREVVEAWK